MKQFKIYVHYKEKLLQLDAEMYYESAQIQRIKISSHGRSFSLQNNYPTITGIQTGKRHKLQWKVIAGTPTDALFLTHVLYQLEKEIKGKQPSKYNN